MLSATPGKKLIWSRSLFCSLMLWRVLSGLALVLSGVETEAATAAPAIPGVSFLDGKQASFLLQHPLASFRVYAFHAGVAVDIPFQIDERDRRDRWVLDQGAKLSADETAGVFDENDVLVFMNRDLGQKGAFAALPAGAMVWGEVRVGNATAPLGFAYVGVFEYPPPLPCPTCAVTRYEEASDRVYAERYALEFHSPLPRHIAFVDKLGEFGANVVAGVHANGEVRFLGGLVTLHKTDADIKTELLGYRNGPVRTIRRARYWIPLPFGFHTAGRVDLLFYRDFVEGTALLKIGISPSLVLANGELQAYFDFLHLDGARVFLDGIGPSEPVDGHMTPAKQSLVGRPARWAALILPQGRTVVFIIHLEGALQQLDQRVYFADSPQPDDKAGGRPLFGFHLGQMNRLKTGTHRLSVFAQVLDSVDLDEIRNAVNVFLSPPEVAVSAFTR